MLKYNHKYIAQYEHYKKLKQIKLKTMLSKPTAVTTVLNQVIRHTHEKS